MKSEFGKGLTYCIGLFLAHAERKVEGLSGNREASIWFNASSDHLYELVIPETFPAYLKQRIKKFRDKCIGWGHSIKDTATTEDVMQAVQEAKDLLRLIDRQFDIPTEKGDWE